MGCNQYWAGRVYDLCVYFMTEALEGSTESGFMEKPGIEPVNPGLQDIGLSPAPGRLLDEIQLLIQVKNVSGLHTTELLTDLHGLIRLRKKQVHSLISSNCT